MSKFGTLNWHIVFLTILSALTILLVIKLSPKERIIEVERTIRDTTTIVKIDTLVITKVVEVERHIVDTMYVPTSGQKEIPIPISQYRFFEDGVYDISAKGFSVTLDQVTVFPKTETITINTITNREIQCSHWDLYLGANLGHYRGSLIPNIILSVKAPKTWLFSASVGYYDKSWIIGGTVQYKLTHNK